MMSLQKVYSKPDDCSVEIPNSCQENDSDFELSKTLTNDNRCPSQSSSLNSNSADICRICHCEGGVDMPLITPCFCSGSLRYVHQTCLQQWIKSSNIRSCELCKFQFIMKTKVKPFNEWEYLDMSGLERKKIFCAMIFHVIAMTCVCWSLYVLLDRTLDEIRVGHLEWPFWTKLIVVGIGIIGGIVFMYIQCKAYFILCKRWRAYNRVIYVQNAPEKPLSHSTKLLASPSEKDNIGPSCSFKTHPDSCKQSLDNIQDRNCIDIKGVRNLHIFFGEENNIRVHRNERENNRALATHENFSNCDDNVNNGLNLDKNHVCGNTSLHIQIGNIDYNRVADLPPCINSNENSYGGALCPADLKNCKQDSEQKFEKCNQNPNDCKSDQSVVKLQIKKAEIVIEFGENSNPNGVTFLNKEVKKDELNKQKLVQSSMRHIIAPQRRCSSEEYLDCEKIANENNELPSSKLLINQNDKVPLNLIKEKVPTKDWKSSEDLLGINKTVSEF